MWGYVLICNNDAEGEILKEWDEVGQREPIFGAHGRWSKIDIFFCYKWINVSRWFSFFWVQISLNTDFSWALALDILESGLTPWKRTPSVPTQRRSHRSGASHSTNMYRAAIMSQTPRQALKLQRWKEQIHCWPHSSYRLGRRQTQKEELEV